MIPINPDLFDRSVLAFFTLLSVMFLGEAWVNIVNKRVSNFSIDYFCKFLAQRVGTKKSRQIARGFPHNKLEIIILGTWAFCAGLAAIQELILWWNKIYK